MQHFILSIFQFYWEYYLLGIILVPGIILAIYAEVKISKTFNMYSKITSERQFTGKQVAELLLSSGRCEKTKVKHISGSLTDNYNHAKETVSLSDSVYNEKSVASIGVAAHEVGHVMQYKNHYFPIKLRNLAIHISNFTSTLLLPLIIIGFIFSVLFITNIGTIVIWIAIGSFALAVIVNLVTLPVEFNASHRALKLLESNGILNNTELSQAKEVLDAAALTYVASLILSVLSLIRFVLALRISRD